MDIKIAFLGTPSFVQPIQIELAKHFTMVDPLNEADLGVIAAYGRILTKDELDTPKYGCINIHPSLLPKYRGPTPIQQAILNEDKISGITVIKMDEKIDHGPIIYQESLGLSNSDNFYTLSKKMFQRSAQILPKIIEDFVTGKVKPTKQNHNQATYSERLAKENGYFPINNPPSPGQLDRMIRAYFPWPGVWTKWPFDAVHPERSRGAQGKQAKIVKFLPGNLIQMEGKKAIPFKDFLNGYPDFPQIITQI